MCVRKLLLIEDKCSFICKLTVAHIRHSRLDRLSDCAHEGLVHAEGEDRLSEATEEVFDYSTEDVDICNL